MRSRIHRLVSFDTPYCQCYIKRDDELPFGSKSRKYQSLLPHILENGVEEVVLIGGVNSNHVLAFTQLLMKNQIKPTLFLKGDPKVTPSGNSFILQQKVSDIHWISRADWPQVDQLAAFYASGKEKVMILPEGGSTKEALPGALSLADEILENEIEFDHIFIDAGTGFTAIALLLGLAKNAYQGKVHVLLLADSHEQFEEKLREFHCHMTNCPFPSHYHLYYPTNARSFGSINSTLMQEVKRIQSEENLLTDPIYSAKLFYELRKLLNSSEISGNVLIVHTGLSIHLKNDVAL